MGAVLLRKKMLNYYSFVKEEMLNYYFFISTGLFSRLKVNDSCLWINEISNKLKQLYVIYCEHTHIGYFIIRIHWLNNLTGAVQGAGGMAVIEINESSGSQSLQCRQEFCSGWERWVNRSVGRKGYIFNRGCIGCYGYLPGAWLPGGGDFLSWNQKHMWGLAAQKE